MPQIGKFLMIPLKEKLRFAGQTSGQFFFFVSVLSNHHAVQTQSWKMRWTAKERMRLVNDFVWIFLKRYASKSDD